MEISNIKFNKLPLDGKGDTMSNSMKVLHYIQEHPNLCKRTNAVQLGKAIALSYGGNASSISQQVQQLLKRGVVTKSGGNQKRTNFRINYFHPRVPQEILDNASEEDKNFMEDVRRRAEDKGGEVGSEGEIITTEPKVIAQDKEIKEEIEQALPVEVKQTRKGTQITFTININL